MGKGNKHAAQWLRPSKKKARVFSIILPDEEAEQIQVSSYIKLKYPDIEFNCDLSGANLSEKQAKEAEKNRSGRGFPDIVIYERKGGYSGLFIELKRTGEKIYKLNGELRKSEHLEEQAAKLKKLNSKGYYAVFCVGYLEAIKTIDNYLNLSN